MRFCHTALEGDRQNTEGRTWKDKHGSDVRRDQVSGYESLDTGQERGTAGFGVIAEKHPHRGMKRKLVACIVLQRVYATSIDLGSLPVFRLQCSILDYLFVEMRING